MAPGDINIEILGKFVWELVFQYDNSGNSGTIEHTYSVEIVESYSSSQFLKSVSETTTKLSESNEVSTEVGASYGPVSASLKYSYTNSKEITDVLQNTTQSQIDQSQTTTTTETRSYTVGPYSTLCLYQRSFVAPGIAVKNDTFRTSPNPLTDDQLEEDVPLEFILRPNLYLVVYTDNLSSEPADRVRELYGAPEDINKGFKGKYVWLVPVWGTDTRKAINNVDLVIQGKADNRYQDLAKGAKGDFRYLIPVHTANNPQYITDLKLLRTPHSTQPDPNSGYTGTTGDINKGRKGDYLYLIWRTQTAYPIEVTQIARNS
ncbi:hypothetical protein BC834DRAFT_824277 [Gloeopeniophorella convolvens]|nr:hypothetical protein BC834DRAFT_824277 [Gloeopeniophorella convolvens]